MWTGAAPPAWRARAKSLGPKVSRASQEFRLRPMVFFWRASSYFMTKIQKEFSHRPAGRHPPRVLVELFQLPRVRLVRARPKHDDLFRVRLAVRPAQPEAHAAMCLRARDLVLEEEGPELH